MQFKTKETNSESVERLRQEQWQSVLEATFGMWADRDDAIRDGVDYVQNVRQCEALPDDGYYGDCAV
ncbi:MAG: hypothetical protein GY796_06605 [Chloroflexi bacterium]|nr:hypothetical protein [Chloroflexota bacterium]